MVHASELRGLDEGELFTKLVDARKELFNLRFQLATGRLDNISRIGQVRKEIASIMTISTERELGLDRTSAAKRAASRAEVARSRGRSRSGGQSDKSQEPAGQVEAEVVLGAEVAEEEK